MNPVQEEAIAADIERLIGDFTEQTEIFVKHFNQGDYKRGRETLEEMKLMMEHMDALMEIDE